MLGAFDMIGAIFLILLLRGGNYGEPPRAESQAASVPSRRDAPKGPSRLESLEAVR
jgi:hypothetical protein